MKRTGLALLAASSLLLGFASAATRPHYGGTLRVAMHNAPASLDPADLNQAISLAERNLSRLDFDTLVTLDARGKAQPSLAISWQTEPGNQRWQFTLRSRVTFHDGTPLTADAAAASLRAANPGWKILASGEQVVIESDSPAPNLPAELSSPRDGIAKRLGGKLLGTGPFVIAQWTPGKQLTLAAYNECWSGRPFLDSIEIQMGQGSREQTLAFDLGKADLIEIAPEQARRAAADGRRVETSAPTELLALVFTRDRQSQDEGHLREALALSIDRGSLNNILLQGGGEAAGGLLPNWITGYEFVFPTNADVAKARQARDDVKQAAPWILAYDASDPAARVVAERISLNAHDAGIALQLSTSSAADLRLMRIPIASSDVGVALAAMSAGLGLPSPKLRGTSTEDIYTAENVLMQSQRVIPLVHLRTNYALSPSIKGWNEDPDGSWHLENLWLSPQKP